MQVVTVIVCVDIEMLVAAFLAEIVEVFIQFHFQGLFKLLVDYSFPAFLI